MKKMNYLMATLVGLSFISCNGKNAEQTEILPVKVKTQQLKPSSINNSRHYSGTVEESQGVNLSFSVPGTLQKIYVKVGSRIEKGKLLASINPTTFENSYKSAKATLIQAQDAYNRMKTLYDKNSLPEIKWIDAQSKLQQAESMEKIAKENLDHCYIYSPFSGVISEKNVEIGQNVTPGIPVLKLTSVNQVKVKIAVPETDISNVQMNGKANIEVAALDNRMFSGTVVEKGVEAHPLSHSYEVKILVDNADRILMPGMVTKVTLSDDDETGQCILPARLLQLDENNNNFVWINRNGKAQKQIVSCGDYTANGVIILSGLTGNEEIIVEGQHKVSNGTRVTTE